MNRIAIIVVLIVALIGSGLTRQWAEAVRGEPIVCTPEDSYRCFMRTEMDFLVLETCVLDKKEQPAFATNDDWKKEFKPD